jgi:hypothetical protein
VFHRVGLNLRGMGSEPPLEGLPYPILIPEILCPGRRKFKLFGVALDRHVRAILMEKSGCAKSEDSDTRYICFITNERITTD